VPAQGSGLPALKQERLNAPAILLLHKVASYAAAKLAEAGVHVAPAPVFYSAARRAEQARGFSFGSQGSLTLACAGGGRSAHGSRASAGWRCMVGAGAGAARARCVVKHIAAGGRVRQSTDA
jgi:hypothetical protein